MAPDVVVRHQYPVLAADLDRVLDDRRGEIGAVAVPDELRAMAVLSGLGRRTRVRVQVDDTVLLRDLGNRVRHTRMKGADQKRRLVARDHAFGHARAGGRRGLGVDVDRLDRPAEHAAFGIELLDRHHRAEALLLAAGTVLAARIHRQADHQRFLLAGLRPGMVLLPRPEERRDAVQAGRGGRQCRDLQQAAPCRVVACLLAHFLPPLRQ